MRKLRLFPAALAVLAAVFAVACTTGPSFRDNERTVTSSIAPTASQQAAKERYSGMRTEGRTGYVKPRVAATPMF